MKMSWRYGRYARVMAELCCALWLLFGGVGCETISSSEEDAFGESAWEEYTVYILWWTAFGLSIAFGDGDGCIYCSPGR